MYSYDLQGKLIREANIPLNVQESDNYTGSSLDRICTGNQGELFILRSGHVYIYDNKLNLVKTISDSKYVFIDIDEDNNLILATEESNSKLLVKKQPIDSQKVIAKSSLNYNSLLLIKIESFNNMVFIITNDNVKSFDINSGELVSEFDPRDYTGFRSVSDIKVENRDNVYLSGKLYNGKASVYKYEKKDQALETIIDKKTITIMTDYPDNNFKAAARSFEKLNPDILINITSGNQENMPGTQYQMVSEDYLKAVNTELMAGKGPDILYGHEWSFDVYARKGILVNLDKYIKSDNKADYYNNILDALKTDGCQYILPVSFMPNTIYANQKILNEMGIEIDDETWTWEDFLNIAKEISNGSRGKYYALKNSGGAQLQSLAIYSNSNYLFDFKNHKTNFNTEYFINLLKTLKTLNGNEISHPDESTRDGFLMRDKQQLKDIAFLINDARSYRDIYEIGNILDNGYTLLTCPRGKDEKAVNSFFGRLCALNINSKAKDEAWKFISYLASEELNDEFLLLEQFSINRKSNQKLKECYKNGSILLLNKVMVKRNPTLPEKNLEEFDKHINRLNFFNLRIFSILPDIASEASKYIYGELNAEEAAGLIQNKMELYMKELE